RVADLMGGGQLRLGEGGLPQHDSGATQVPEDARTPRQIAGREAPRILHQPEEPLESHHLHPNRRTPLVTGYEVERGSDAQGESSGLGTRTQGMRQRLLLWRAHGQEAESERARGLDEIQALLDSGGIIDEAHGRVVMPEIRETELPGNLLGLVRCT